MVLLDKPQIHTVCTEPLQFSASDVHWLPCAAKLVAIGQNSRGAGVVQVYELAGTSLEKVVDTEKPHALKCSTFGASPLHLRHLATGDYDGNLTIYDLERLKAPVYTTKAHNGIINSIDGCGGVGVNVGPPEIVTGSRDGFVKVWDTRQRDSPVASIAPAQGETPRDVWTVAFGNSYNDEERVVASGYENGDIKVFDLRNMSLLYETNLKNGVCCMEFDRKDIKMNKLAAVTLEAKVHVYDMRTKHPEKGYASVTHSWEDNTTVWTIKHLPQNRDIFMASANSGGINIFKYKYPEQRSKMDSKESHPEGVAGTLELLNDAIVAEQPVSSFAWSPDKLGLCAFTSFDQQLRIGMVTRLNLQ